MVHLAEGATLTELTELLKQAESLDDCEAIFSHLTESQGPDDDRSALIADAQSKIDVLEQDGRVELADGFTGEMKVVETLADGRLRVRAIIAQVDKVNLNQRLYPKKVMVEALKLANAQAKRGAITALADHPGFFSDRGVRDVVVKWEAFMLKKNDLHAEGVTVLTEAGKDVTTVWQSGVALEWSIRGYGKAQEITDKDGKWMHDEIHDYILKGADVVLDGAAKTKTMSLSVENNQEPEEGIGDEMTAEEKKLAEDEETRKVAEAEAAKVAEAKVLADSAAVEAKVAAAEAKKLTDAKSADADATAIAEKVHAMMKADGAEDGDGNKVLDAATALIEKRFEERALEDHRKQTIAGLTLTDEQRIPIERAVALADSRDAVDEVMATFAPVLEAMIAPSAPDFNGKGIMSPRTVEKARREQWFIGDNFEDRPESAEGVMQALVDSYPESEGREGLDSPKWIFEKLLKTMWNDGECYKYFHSASRQGFQEATTTTSTLGTLHPQILPMMRRLYPMLIPYEIAGVQPLNQPTGTIHTLQFDDDSGNDLSDSSNFDSSAADHTEAATKMQIVPRFVQQAVTARSKAVQYDITNELRQDIRAIHGLDADAELITAATNEIARQTNFTFLDMMRLGATALTQTYGTQVPAAGTYNGQEWNDRLGAFLIRARGAVSEKMYHPPDWIVAGPGAAGVLQSMNVGGIKAGDKVSFGTGLNSIGIAGGTMTVYEATWFARNTMLFGYRPPSWSHTAAVFSPYIALFISPEDYTASTNTLARSVSSRFAQTVTNGNGFSLINISDVAGTDISSW